MPGKDETEDGGRKAARVEPKEPPAKRYRVANPRGIPKGRHVLRVGARRWQEGNVYHGPVTERLLREGFIVEEVSDG